MIIRGFLVMTTSRPIDEDNGKDDGGAAGRSWQAIIITRRSQAGRFEGASWLRDLLTQPDEVGISLRPHMHIWIVPDANLVGYPPQLSSDTLSLVISIQRLPGDTEPRAQA